ncbi:MAG: transglutaminase domain-containing protein, partial [Micromonosporaceae bacterium]|nr:transglutaminase domain-containing protein [Micromonosporaceae bacterium]
ASLLLVLAVLALAGLAGGRVASGPPAAAADLVPQPVNPRATISPLSLFPALRTGHVALHLAVESAENPKRLRFATLTEFDGTYWTSSALYRRAGTTLPAGPPQQPSRVVEDHVHVFDGGSLGWLFSQGRPVQVSVPGLGVDPATGDVVLPTDRPVPTDYTVRSRVPTSTVDDWTDAVTAPAATTGRYPIPADLTLKAENIVQAQFGYPALAALAGWFASKGGFSLASGDQAPAGHGIFQIQRLLRDKVGTAEQYASAFAVLARGLGYDTRVAVGFSTRRSGGVLTVDGHDVDAWPEVRFETLGWIPFQPTPSRAAGNGSGPVPGTQPSPTPSGNDPAAAPTSSTVDGTGADRTGHAGVPWLRLAITAALAVAALAGLTVAAALAVAPVRRLRRRRRADPARRMAGAWRDTLETLRRCGVPVAAASTSGQLARLARDRLGTPCGDLTARAARVHDQAAYAPAGATRVLADSCWLFADGLRHAARRQPLRARLAARLRNTRRRPRR